MEQGKRYPFVVLSGAQAESKDPYPPSPPRQQAPVTSHQSPGNGEPGPADGAIFNSQFSIFNCPLPAAWDALLGHPFAREPHCRTLAAAEALTALETVYPPREDWFAAFRLTPPERVRVVILGQDPYHAPGQAMGLAFSVRAGVPLPPSLRNIYKELSSDLGLPAPQSGDLTAWAEQGVLLLNTVLTVRAGAANSHKALGWQAFTREVISAAARLPQPVAFVLWGAPAQRAYAEAAGTSHQSPVTRDQGADPPAAASIARHAIPRTDEATGNGEQASDPPAAASTCALHGYCSPRVPRTDEGTGNGEQGTAPDAIVNCQLSILNSQLPRLILTAPHPSPLSAYRGFFGSRPFSQINAFLAENGQAPIQWTK